MQLPQAEDVVENRSSSSPFRACASSLEEFGFAWKVEHDLLTTKRRWLSISEPECTSMLNCIPELTMAGTFWKPLSHQNPPITTVQWKRKPIKTIGFSWFWEHFPFSPNCLFLGPRFEPQPTEPQASSAAPTLAAVAALPAAYRARALATMASRPWWKAWAAGCGGCCFG